MSHINKLLSTEEQDYAELLISLVLTTTVIIMQVFHLMFICVFVVGVVKNHQDKESVQIKTLLPRLCNSLWIQSTYSGPKNKCTNNGMVTSYHGGRLGNELWEYASLLSSAKVTGFHPYASGCLLTVLGRMFQNLTIPSIDSISDCNIRKEDVEEFEIMFHYDSNDIYINTSKIRGDIYDTFKRHKKWEPFLLIMPFHYIMVEEMVVNKLDYVRREFKFKPKLKSQAQDVLDKYLTGLRSVSFVGIHVKRNDFLDLWEVHQEKPTLSSYYRRAMRYYEEKFVYVVFLVISDDPEWCFLNVKSNRSEVRVVSTVGEYPVALDLAIMAACNHSIIDYGSFGVWGALLAGGETIVYDMMHKSTYAITNLLDNWHFMS